MPTGKKEPPPIFGGEKERLSQRGKTRRLMLRSWKEGERVAKNTIAAKKKKGENSRKGRCRGEGDAEWKKAITPRWLKGR